MDLSIGLTGLRVAQRAIELIGTNIANAGTEGYHRQEPDIRTVQMFGRDGLPLAGTRIANVQRVQDLLLEREITGQTTLLSRTSQELIGMEAIESLLVEPQEGGLSGTLQSFFSAMRELSAQPRSEAHRRQVIWTADALATELNSMSKFVSDLRDNVFLQAQTVVDQINSLTGRIAKLNDEIVSLRLADRNTNILDDQRDQAIAELSELADVRQEGRRSQDGRITLSIGGIPVVQGNNNLELEVSLVEDGRIGLGLRDAGLYRTTGFDGRLGGLMTLRNDFFTQVTEQLDTLAGEIISQINRHHVSGLGTQGSFTMLTGWSMPDTTVSEWENVTADENVRMRLLAEDGTVSWHSVAIASTDTLADIAAKFDAIDPTDAKFDAGIVGGALRLEGRNGYRFDFLPPIISDTSGLTGGDIPAVTVDGLFDGSNDETFTITVQGGGEVGVTENLTLEVKNSSGQVVRTLEVGLGYAAGDFLNVGNGIQIALGAGTMNDAETITIQTVAVSDPAGLLSAAGINTFFDGSTARDIRVSDALKADATLLATSRGSELSDNEAILKMSGVADENLPALGNLTPIGYHQQFVTSVGRDVMIRKARQESLENVLQQLSSHRDDLSGVDVNEEAAKLLVFERMYQAVATVIRVQNEAISTLMDLL